MLDKLIDHMKNFVTENRYDLFLEKINFRTDYLTVVLEDIYQSQNASAVLRTCDCFGIQDVHIIENTNDYKINPDVALGSFKWLNLIKYNQRKNNTLLAINELKKQGYRIIATTPHTNDVLLDDFDLNKGKSALFLGNELKGVSDIVMENADEYLRIPMYGFTESFNISVSAAIILHSLSDKLHKTNIDWHLNNEKQKSIILNWLKTTIKDYELIEKRYFETLKK